MLRCVSEPIDHALISLTRSYLPGFTEDIFAIARAVRAGVAEKFGVELVPEPVVVNGKI